jgi:hypothetical protein
MFTMSGGGSVPPIEFDSKVTASRQLVSSLARSFVKPIPT